MKELRINCQEFESLLSEYLDSQLDPVMQSLVAEHALQCPLCHDLLNEVRKNLDICKNLPLPQVSLAKLEASILSSTMPEASMSCEEFERYLTDYLDGFLPAPLFHRWERHAILCNRCSDLPGLVVRSIGACYSYKNEELPVPDGLHEKILLSTIGTTQYRKSLKISLAELVFTIKKLSAQWAFQLAPVAMMLLFVMFVLMQTADGGLTKVYEKSLELADQTYRQGANVISNNMNENKEESINQSIDDVSGKEK